MLRRDLLAEAEAAVAAGLAVVGCTVVATRGSTPQKAGAAMLVYATGGQSGTLGGGCVEAEVRRRALQSLAASDARPAFHVFTLDNDYGWDDGLVCGGRMTVLADPLDPTAAAFLRTHRELADAGNGFTELVVLPDHPAKLPPGSRHLFDAAGRPVASRHAPPDIAATLAAVVPPLASRPKPSVAGGVAVLPTLPRVRLLIVGGGHVGRAVADLAATLDFDVWVVDDREATVTAERFPHASRRIVGDIGRILQSLAPEMGPSTFGVIVTRGHSHDEEALFHLARSAAGYVGMIGSRRKIRLIFDDLRAKGVTDDMLARVRAPIGLPIGSETVAEIAVSIVAELVARRNLGPPGT